MSCQCYSRLGWPYLLFYTGLSFVSALCPVVLTHIFQPNLKVGFPFLRDGNEIGKVLCTVYKSVFSIENGGHSDITQNVKQKKYLLVLSSSSSNKVRNFFISNL